MSRINRIVCDKCKNNIEDATGSVKLQIIKSGKDNRDYRKYTSEGRVDLCEKCYKDFRENYLEN